MVSKSPTQKDIFKSICHHPYHSFTDAKLLDEGKEYTILTCYTSNGAISHYDIYDGDTPVIVYNYTVALSVVIFHQYFYTFDQMRDIKLKQLLNKE